MKRIKALIFLVIVPFFIGFTEGICQIETMARSAAPKVGEMAPEISLLSTDRTTTYKLSDFKGKLVLVNFWASLAAPCRFENPNLLRAYQHYAAKSFRSGNGFIVLSVSMDTDTETWRTAIAKDNLVWPYHVSDLKGYDSEVAKIYGVKAIPSNFLIDGTGKVIAVNLRGAELIKALEEQLR